MTAPIQNLTEIRDQTACNELLSVLKSAIYELRALGEEPVVVASCPSKFNDAGNDRDCRAIRVGPFFSQRTEYFGKPDDYEDDLREGTENARAASATLEQLEAERWRELYERAFERFHISIEEVIALVLQDGKDWLVLNGSNSGESAVYAVTADGLVHVGKCDYYGPRFDQGLTEERPLVLRTVEEDSAGRATAVHLIEEFERAAPQATPDWCRRTYPFWRYFTGSHEPEAQALAKRVTALAESGRVSLEDYKTLEEIIRRSFG